MAKTQGKWCEICHGTIKEDEEAVAVYPAPDGWAHERCFENPERYDPDFETDNAYIDAEESHG